MDLSRYFDQSWIDHIGENELLNSLILVNNVLTEERQTKEVLPEVGSKLIFKAFKEVPLDKVKVVILGMDIYHDDSFNGLAFGNGEKDNTKVKSPSLRNILKEVKVSKAGDGVDASLYSWSNQGVLLTNTAHTVVKGQAGSHLDLWADFTRLLLSSINSVDNVIWMLWGNQAKSYKSLIENETHEVIISGHPSPLNSSNPFVGCNCFNKCNEILETKNINKLKW